ncbi:MAG: gephyrin-like molybdotransferase Glp [Candidatus Bathyarchaeia archaeon]
MVGRRKMEGFPTLISVEEALGHLRRGLSLNQASEDVQLHSALGMVVAKDLIAHVDVPPFDRSAVEGYAVVAANTTSASPTNPVELAIAGRSEAGSTPSEIPSVSSGTALEIFTGAPIPKGADAVVMVEYSKRAENAVRIYKSAAPMHNVSRRGEDFAEGNVIVKTGTRLKSWHIGALASVNLTSVPVYKKLRIAVLSTGNELREPGETLRPGEIVNSSRPMIKALIFENDCEPVDLGTIPDDLSSITNALSDGLTKADILVTTGGTSLGERDLVPEAVAQLGEPGLVVHGVSMRPAKPTGAGFVRGKPVFMLSGYPVAALVAFEVFVVPTINWMQGTFEPVVPLVRARLTRKVAAPIGVRSYMRVRLFRDESGMRVEPLRLTGSGILSSMTKANGVLVIPEHMEGYDENEEVEVRVIQPLEAAS